MAISACVSVQLGVYPKWFFFQVSNAKLIKTMITFFPTSTHSQCFCAMTLFYCAHWQTYVSGTLRFGKVDVTEAQIAIIIIHLISAVFGPSVWMTKVRLLFAGFFPALLQLSRIFQIMISSFLLFTFNSLLSQSLKTSFFYRFILFIT